MVLHRAARAGDLGGDFGDGCAGEVEMADLFGVDLAVLAMTAGVKRYGVLDAAHLDAVALQDRVYPGLASAGDRGDFVCAHLLVVVHRDHLVGCPSAALVGERGDQAGVAQQAEFGVLTAIDVGDAAALDARGAAASLLFGAFLR